MGASLHMSKLHCRGKLQLWKYAVQVFEGNVRPSEDNTHHLKIIFQLFIIDNKAIQTAVFREGTPHMTGRLVTDTLDRSAVFCSSG
jgi:hypothetical protein